MVIHVIRNSRGASVVGEVLDGCRPIDIGPLISIDIGSLISMVPNRVTPSLAGCLAHQLRDCQYATEAADAVFAPRMKTLLLRAVMLALGPPRFGLQRAPRTPATTGTRGF